jgi:hypothetical protein
MKWIEIKGDMPLWEFWLLQIIGFFIAIFLISVLMPLVSINTESGGK